MTQSTNRWSAWVGLGAFLVAAMGGCQDAARSRTDGVGGEHSLPKPGPELGVRATAEPTPALTAGTRPETDSADSRPDREIQRPNAPRMAPERPAAAGEVTDAAEPQNDRREAPAARPEERTAPENATPVREPEPAGVADGGKPLCRYSEDCSDGDFVTVDLCAPESPDSGADGCVKLPGAMGCPPPSQPLCTHLERVEPWQVGLSDEVGPLYSCLVRWAYAPLGDLDHVYWPDSAGFSFGHDDTLLHFWAAVAPTLATDPMCGAPHLYFDESMGGMLEHHSGWELSGYRANRTWIDNAWWGEAFFENLWQAGPLSDAVAAYGEGMSAPDEAAILRLLYRPRSAALASAPVEAWPDVLEAAVCTDWVQSATGYDLGSPQSESPVYDDYPQARTIYDPALQGFVTAPSPNLPVLECGVLPSNGCGAVYDCWNQVFPGGVDAFEVCLDFLDNDCDGLLDESCAPLCSTHSDCGSFDGHVSFCAPGHPEATAEGCVYRENWADGGFWPKHPCKVMPAVTGIAPLETGESGHLCALNLMGMSPEWPATQPEFTVVELETTFEFDPNQWALLAVYDGNCTATSCQGPPLVGGGAPATGGEIGVEGSASHVLVAEPATAEEWNASGKITLRWVATEGSPLMSVPMGPVSTGLTTKWAPTMHWLVQPKLQPDAVPDSRPKLIAPKVKTAAGNTTTLATSSSVKGYYFPFAPYGGWPSQPVAIDYYEMQSSCETEPEPNWEPPPGPEPETPSDTDAECMAKLFPLAESGGGSGDTSPQPEATCEEVSLLYGDCPAGSAPLCSSLVPFEGDGIGYPLGSYLRCAVSWIDTEPPESPDALAAFQLKVDFEQNALELMGMVADLCFGTFCAPLPVALPPEGQVALPLAKGHQVSWGPPDIAEWNAQGGGALIVVNFAGGIPVASAHATYPMGEITGDPQLFQLVFRVPPGAEVETTGPPLPCASQIVGSTSKSLSPSVKWHPPTGAFVSVPKW